jgi:two-component system LytT family response regulator
MITAILVDDEQDALESLSWVIKRFSKEIDILDTFTDPVEAISAINYLKPDCVFLDIEMPEMDGFQLLSQLNYKDFDLIITTAYDNYAIQAFKESAVDYLLKPVDFDDIAKVTKKIVHNKNNNNLGKELKSTLDEIISAQLQTINKVALPLNKKTVFVNVDDIIYCKSEGNYTTVYLINKEEHLLAKLLKEVEHIINSKHFIRTHQSYLVNINYIKEYIKSDGYYLVLENRISIPVSKANRTFLLKTIESS